MTILTVNRSNQTTNGTPNDDIIIFEDVSGSTANGLAGNDTISAPGDRNILNGNQGDDFLSVTGSNNTVNGGLGNDSLGFGINLGSVGAENNSLIIRNNTLVGGAGSDIFRLPAVSLVGQPGENLIQDFQDGQDKIRLANFLNFDSDDISFGGSLGDLLNSGLDDIGFRDLVIQQQGSDVVISVRGDAIVRLQGIRANQITAADFIDSERIRPGADIDIPDFDVDIPNFDIDIPDFDTDIPDLDFSELISDITDQLDEVLDDLSNRLNDIDAIRIVQSGNRRIVGGNTKDLLIGRTSSDRLIGKAGDDTLIGDIGRDLLIGGLGRDALLGGAGRDNLRGGRGSDILDGGAGRNSAVGGLGKDLFVLGTDGQLIIRDFEKRRDRLVLDDDVRAGQVDITRRGRNTIIEVGDRTLAVLRNTNTANIDRLIVKADSLS